MGGKERELDKRECIMEKMADRSDTKRLRERRLSLSSSTMTA